MNYRVKKNEKQRLAIFASNITRNPHGFDEGQELHTLLIQAISYLLNKPVPKNAEQKVALMYQAGIIKDDLSSYTICSGLIGYKGTKVHLGWKGFYESKEPIQISLWNLSKIQKVVVKNKKVFVVENPTVFSEILSSSNNISIICTGGQVKLASLILLDLISQQDVKIYYSGDYDPEGLNIADKLKERYKEKLIFWRYEQSDYLKAISDKKITEKSLSKLNSIKSKELQTVVESIQKYKLAGYQEILIKELIEDIQKNNALQI